MRVPVLAGCALLVAACPASSTTIHVAPDSSGDYLNIQAAIDAASSGDEIVLSDGTFTGDGNWDLNFGTKDLMLRSLNGYEATTFEGGDPYYCFAIGHHRVVTLDGGQTSATRIEGVTIQDFAPGPDDGTIRCIGSSPVLHSVRIWSGREGTQSNGLYLFVQGGSPIIQDCFFEGNCDQPAHSEGLAIYSRDAWLTVDRCSFLGITTYGSAVDLDGGTFTDCHFLGIGGYKRPGGRCVYVPEGQVSFQRCSFRGTFGWGVYALRSAELLFENCSFEHIIGLPAIQSSGPTTVRNTTFHNGFDPDGGGAVACEGSDVAVTLDHCVFLNNTTEYPGGASALSALAGHVQVTHCTFAGNRNVLSGYRGSVVEIGSGADVLIDHTIIAFGGQSGLPDGAVHCYGVPAQLDVSCSDFFGNTGGDWTGCVAGMDGMNGNISADPLFCDFGNGNLGLQAQSPCAPPNSGECGLIGALAVGCGTTALQEHSWGSIKALYR